MLSKATLPWRSASSSTRNVRLLTAILRQYYTVRSVDEQLRSTLQRSRHQCNIQRAYTVDHSSSASPASSAALMGATPLVSAWCTHSTRSPTCYVTAQTL
jgi:hypothetical protein